MRFLLYIVTIWLTVPTLSYSLGKASWNGGQIMAQSYSHLYLHLDKTHYQADETIWFTAYRYGADDSSFVLFVSLHHLDRDSIVSTEKFILENGMAYGSVDLDHRFPPGSYRLIAYTNFRIAHPELLPFQQRIEIETGMNRICPAFVI